MAYRICKKTTKTTEYKCLKCKHVKPDNYKIEFFGCYVECNAENKCISGKFNAKDFYCVEYKSFNELSASEIREMKEKADKEYFKKAYKEYCRKYFPKKQADKMIKEKLGK